MGDLEFKACEGCICIDYRKFFGFRIVIQYIGGKNDSDIGKQVVILFLFSGKSGVS